MSHKLFLSHSIEEKVDAKYLGEFNSVQEMWALSYAHDIGRRSQYCRYLMFPDYTSIDFGSHSMFLLVEPPFTMEELNK